MLFLFSLLIYLHLKSDVYTILSNGLMHSQSAVQNKHMFVYNPDSGRSVVINASLVDVSPILILYHSVINDCKIDKKLLFDTYTYESLSIIYLRDPCISTGLPYTTCIHSCPVTNAGITE